MMFAANADASYMAKKMVYAPVNTRENARNAFVALAARPTEPV
jgi:hypothetical protein